MSKKQKQFNEKDLAKHYGTIMESTILCLKGACERLYSQTSKSGTVSSLYDLGIDSFDSDTAAKFYKDIYNKLGEDNIETLLELLRNANQADFRSPK